MNYSYLKNKSFWLPTVLFFVFLILILVFFKVGEYKYYSLSRALTQWDGQHYLSIARDGYQKFPCEYNPLYICGNVGWFPFYPIAGRVLSLIGINIRWAMIIMSWLSLWIALLIFFRMVCQKFNERTAFFSLLALLLFPGSFYFLTAFPYSLYLLLSVTILFLIEKKKFTFLFLLTGLLAVTYPSGVVIGLPIVYYLISNWKKLNRFDRVKLSMALVSIGLALFLYSLYYWFKFDDFFLYNHFQAQSYFAHRLTLPFLTIFKSLMYLKNSHPVFLILLYIIITLLLFYSRKIDISWQIFMFGILLFTPAFGTTVSYYRQIVVAFPLFVMIGYAINSQRRKYLLGIYAAGSLILTWAVYLSAYKLGNLM